MPDWDSFEKLSSSPERNFEKLCREIVKRHYSSYGSFEETKNEPGIEFSIILDKDNDRIGKKGEQIGWQCKWFLYNTNGSLKSAQRKEISHSLETTEKYFPTLTTWILWTHKGLSKADVDWFCDLQKNYPFKLQLWNDKDIDGLLTGNALELQQCFFGTLAITPGMLTRLHEISVAPIKSRWIPEVHVQTDCEKEVRLILGDPYAWKFLQTTGDELSILERQMQKEVCDPIYESKSAMVQTFKECCEQFATWSRTFSDGFSSNCFYEIEQTEKNANSFSLDFAWNLLTDLRCSNMPLSLYVTNALACILKIQTYFSMVTNKISEQFIAIVADAGAGKTQFSAELTAKTESSPGGVLILGRTLKKGDTLDTLAGRIQFYDKPVESFQNLICAVDMLGTRENCRVPIVIDGLNEAENPQEWKDLLSGIIPILKNYSNVVLVCTLRAGEKSRHNDYALVVKTDWSATERNRFVTMSLPDKCHIIDSQGFTEQDLQEAIPKYFSHYRIKADPSRFITSFFSHPLTLRIFCEVTNQKREKTVEITSYPSSIYNLFGMHVANIAKTISEMVNLTVHYQVKNVLDAAYFLGEALWTENKRSIREVGFFDLYRKSMEANSDWNSNIINLFVQEGLIFRNEERRCEYWLTPVYDMLGGFFVANYLLENHKNDVLTCWVNTPEFTEKLFGENGKRHQLSEDILCALVALIPSQNHQNELWKAVDEKYRSDVIALSPLIDSEFITKETIVEYSKYILRNNLSDKIINDLDKLRFCCGHPFNADFLNSILKDLSVKDRDLSWTEHIRRSIANIISVTSIKEQVNKYTVHWRNCGWENLEQERLRAVYCTWLLTTTCPELRYALTEALFYYGLHEPENLFTITLSLLNVNDPYITERLLAASYGVIGTILHEEELQPIIAAFGKQLQRRMFSSIADAATSHLLSRDYAASIIKSIQDIIPETFTKDEWNSVSNPFPDMPKRKWEIVIPTDVHVYGESPFRMDFENYVIGRLVRDRENYDYANESYKEIRGKILWRVYNLGWNTVDYLSIEKNIEQEVRSFADVIPKIERYGKKYSWIAYYEMAGVLDDERKLEKYGTTFGRDLDPFFPTIIRNKSDKDFLFLGNSMISTSEWIEEGNPPDISTIMHNVLTNNELNNWVLLYADIVEDSDERDRRAVIGINNYFVAKKEKTLLQDAINSEIDIRWPGHIDKGDIYTYEIYKFHEYNEIGQESIEVLKFIKKHMKKVPNARINNGNIEFSTELKEFQTPIYHHIESFQPVFTYSFYFNWGKDGFSYPLLSPWIVKTLNLRFNPNTLVYTDKDNKNAVSHCITIQNKHHNSQKLLFLRKDLFESLLKTECLECAVQLVGERSNSYSLDNRGLTESPKYKTFQQISFYQNESQDTISCIP